MPQLHSISVNGCVYELPSQKVSQYSPLDPYIGSLSDLARVMQSTGISAREMTNAILKMNEVLGRLDWAANEITAVKDSLHDLRDETENIQSGLDCRTAELEMEISDLRSAMDAKTENPNQNSDLEIFSQIEWDEHFLNFGPSNIFLN